MSVYACNAIQKFRKIRTAKRKNFVVINAGNCGGQHIPLLFAVVHKRNSPVLSAVKHFSPIKANIVNSAPVFVTENPRRYTMIQNEMFDKIFRYQTIMAWARSCWNRLWLPSQSTLKLIQWWRGNTAYLRAVYFAENRWLFADIERKC